MKKSQPRPRKQKIRNKKPSRPPTDREMLLGQLRDLMSNNPDDLISYFAHCGIPETDTIAALQADPPTIDQLWLRRWRIQGDTFDLDAAANALLTWPPVAARIALLQAEKDWNDVAPSKPKH